MRIFGYTPTEWFMPLDEVYEKRKQNIELKKLEVKK